MKKIKSKYGEDRRGLYVRWGRERVHVHGDILVGPGGRRALCRSDFHTSSATDISEDDLLDWARRIRCYTVVKRALEKGTIGDLFSDLSIYCPYDTGLGLYLDAENGHLWIPEGVEEED